MMLISDSSNKTISTNEFILTIALSLVCVLILPFSIYSPVIILIFFIVYRYGKKGGILISLVSLMAATGPALEKYRFLFSIVSILYVFYIFIKEKGLDFKNYRRPPTEIFSLIIFIITAIFLTSIISGFQGPSILAIFRSIVFFTICYALYSILEIRELFRIYLLALIFAALIVSVTVYYDLINAGLTLYIVQGVLARYAGIYGNPNYVGLLLSISTIILFAYLFSDKINSLLQKIVVWIILLSNILIILITNSRASIIGTIISFFFILFHFNKKLLQKVLFSLSVISIILISIPSVQDFYSAFVRLETVSERSVHWSAGWEIMIDNFLFGIGPEIFPSKIFSYVPSSAWQFFEVDTSVFKLHPHNYFLLMIAENGILGLIFSLLVFYMLFRLSWRVMKISKNNNREEYLVSISIYSIGIVLFVRAFFEVDGIFSYGFITRDIPFWINYIIISHLYSNHYYLDNKYLQLNN